MWLKKKFLSSFGPTNFLLHSKKKNLNSKDPQ